MLSFHSNQSKYFSFLKLFHIKKSKKNHLTPIRMAITNQPTNKQNKYLKKQIITSIDKDIEKLKPCALLVGMYNGAATRDNRMTIPQKIKNRNAV